MRLKGTKQGCTGPSSCPLSLLGDPSAKIFHKTRVGRESGSTWQKERGSPRPLQREKNLIFKRESIINMFGSFPLSLGQFALPSLLGRRGADVVIQSIELVDRQSKRAMAH